jgi:hypothetical protein
MTISINEIFYLMGLTQSDGGFYALVRGIEPVLKLEIFIYNYTWLNNLRILAKDKI